MPISVNAVGKPSMIATTISASISRPMCPVVRLSQGVRNAIIRMTSPMHDRPNHNALWIFIGEAPRE
ncbi:hypothetical protein LMG1860_05921 [Achromobacter denitrificans]|nr:hypothetical protein LMG1231_05745 [Achromobacter denitrificans]CAB3912300.1 hypothetical protein LMG1860_05921 [Achromobacter denitrificans]